MECRLITSDDEGESWSEVNYCPPLTGPEKNKLIELANGYLLCPTSGVEIEITCGIKQQSWEKNKTE